MLSDPQLHRAMEVLPFLRSADARDRRAFAARAVLMRLPAGATVFEEGAECSALAILLDGRHTLKLTHAEIAAELGTSCEVVSRIVEDPSEKRLVSAQRGSITVLDRARLERQTLSPNAPPRPAAGPV